MDKKQAEQAQKELDQIKDRVKELERIMNEPKVSKEKEMSDFLFSMLKETTAKITGEKGITHYNLKNEWLVQEDYKNGYLWVRYLLIWSIFESKFNLNYNEIKEFISSWVESNTGWKGLTPKIAR
jgi:phage antirepressor YoqD-like protein